MLKFFSREYLVNFQVFNWVYLRLCLILKFESYQEGKFLEIPAIFRQGKKVETFHIGNFVIKQWVWPDFTWWRKFLLINYLCESYQEFREASETFRNFNTGREEKSTLVTQWTYTSTALFARSKTIVHDNYQIHLFLSFSMFDNILVITTTTKNTTQYFPHQWQTVALITA